MCKFIYIIFFKFPYISDVTCYLSFLKEVLTYILVVFFLSYSPNITPQYPIDKTELNLFLTMVKKKTTASTDFTVCQGGEVKSEFIKN